MINQEYGKDVSFYAEYLRKNWEKVDEQKASNNSADQERQVQGCACAQPVKSYMPEDNS